MKKDQVFTGGGEEIFWGEKAGRQAFIFSVAKRKIWQEQLHESWLAQ